MIKSNLKNGKLLSVSLFFQIVLIMTYNVQHQIDQEIPSQDTDFRMFELHSSMHSPYGETNDAK